MKTIYINRAGQEKRRRRWPWTLLFTFVLILGVARVVAPYALVNYINQRGSDEEGLFFRISDIDLNILETKVFVDNFRVYNSSGDVVLAELTGGEIDFDPIEILKSKSLGDQDWVSAEITLSKALNEEINRLKKEKKEKFDTYFDRLSLSFKQLDIRQVQNEDVKTLLSLTDTGIKFRKVGFGDPPKETSFTMNSAIKEGGSLHLEGETALEQDNTPWTFSGDLKGAPAPVLEKLAGGELPIEIREAKVDASIIAHSEGGAITGSLTPKIKDFRLKEKSDSALKRTIAKATNFIAKKATDDKEPEFTIPFTLNENFTLNFEATLKQWFR